MRSVSPNIRSDFTARITCSCTNPLKQTGQNAALCRGRLITAFVLHFVQFMVLRLLKTLSSGVLSRASPCDVPLRVRLSRPAPCGLAGERFEQPHVLSNSVRPNSQSQHSA